MPLYRLRNYRMIKIFNLKTHRYSLLLFCFFYISIILIITLSKPVSLAITDFFSKIGLIESSIGTWSNALIIYPFRIIPGFALFYWYNAIGNFLLFLPLGMLLYLNLYRFKKAAIIVFFTSALFSFTIETMQYFVVKRDADINDLIFNTAGAFAGILIIVLFKKYRH